MAIMSGPGCLIIVRDAFVSFNMVQDSSACIVDTYFQLVTEVNDLPSFTVVGSAVYGRSCTPL